MSIGEMQACLARLYVNEAFRGLFYVDPSAALDGYCLSREESDAIRKLDRGALDLFATSLIGKRRKQVERAYPLLFAHEGAAMRRCYLRFYQLYPGRLDRLSHQDVVDFGKFIEDTLRQVENVPAYVSDLARYERMCYLAAIAITSSGPRDQLPDSEQKPARVTTMETRPLLRLDVQVGDFAYDVSEIEAKLQRGSAPAEARLGGGGCSIVFRPGISGSGVRMLRINTPTRTVIHLCDGNRTVTQVVANTEEILRATNLNDVIVDTINRLLALEVLVLDSAKAANVLAGPRPYSSAVQIESA